MDTNKTAFLDLVNSIEREGMKKEELINKLINSDFFFAPASTRYHGAYAGGLCEHSLNVYNNLKTLLANKFPVLKTITKNEQGEEVETLVNTCPYSEDTVKLVALFHDFSKMNLYEATVRNIKVYSDEGSKNDELGRFEWKSERTYKKREESAQFIFGTHGETSNFMLSCFVPLLMEESIAIINHHSSYDNPNLDVTAIYNRYTLACLLHVADMISTYVDEKVN